mmetsp:Transcript_41250/g.106710  ORF Transcript_41250/g.106710 Transcript_41250/m.106710 type:complete len:210 (-) Transcript_41250:796-1425(-)
MQSPHVIEDNNREASLLCKETRSLLDEAEKSGDDMIRKRVEEKLKHLSKTLDTYKTLIASEPVHKRDVWFRRHQAKWNEYEDLRKGLQRLGSKMHPSSNSARDALLSGARKTISQVGNAWDEATSIARSSQMISDLQKQGVGVLGNLSEQKDTLKAARRKLLDVLNTLGVSRSLLSVIERRQNIDKYIVYGGIAVTLLILITLLYFRYT